MSQQNYSRIESGDVNPKFETIAHIASILDISLDELTDRAIHISNNTAFFNGSNNVYHSPKEALLLEKLVEEKERVIQSLWSKIKLLREINEMLKAGR